jgi:hypothetical protein
MAYEPRMYIAEIEQPKPLHQKFNLFIREGLDQSHTQSKGLMQVCTD